MEVTEETTQAAEAAAPEKTTTQPNVDVTIHLVGEIDFGEGYTDKLYYTADEQIGQDQHGVTIKFADGRIIWIPTANIAGVTTEPRE